MDASKPPISPPAVLLAVVSPPSRVTAPPQAVLEWEEKDHERQKHLASIHGEGYKPSAEEDEGDGSQFVVRGF